MSKKLPPPPPFKVTCPYCGRLEWIRGKVKFGGCKDRAIMPSLVVVFDRKEMLT